MRRDNMANHETQMATPATTVETSKEAHQAGGGEATTHRRKGSGSGSSRRALLKLGGAAAAAGVAAVAAGATDLTHSGTAHAHADTVTFLQSASGSGNIAIEGDGSSGAVGVFGVSDTNVGVYAQSNANATSALYAYGTGTTGKGAWGFAPTGIGVEGQSDSGTGVYGSTGSGTAAILGDASSGPSSTGVWGIGGGHGVTGNSPAGRGGAFSGGLVPLYLQPGGSAGAPPFVGYAVGDVYVDNTGVFFIRTTTGWVRLTGVQSGMHGGAISYLSTPIRLLDARSSASSGLVNRGPLAGNELYAFAVAGLGGSGIPTNAQGLIGNVTVLGPSSGGNLSLFPAGGATPTVASMTFGTAGLFLANGVNVAIGSGGAINIQNQSSGTTPLVLDAVAYVS
jgi:hypothetical protein